MISSPPSASTGSSLYIHLPAVQSSSYIGGQQDTMVRKGFSLYVMCSLRERSLALSQAASGVPANSPARFFCGSTTMQKQNLSALTIVPARSTTLRTGVHLLPIIIGLVTTAPSQWKKFSIAGPPTPGKRYLLPPEKPTTSCGKTGPTMMILSYSKTLRLISTGTSIEKRPLVSWLTTSGLSVPIRLRAAGLFHS